jgi:hypothetical protein
MIGKILIFIGGLGLHIPRERTTTFEVEFTAAGETTEYRRGFIDCLDLIEDILGSVKRLKQPRSYLLTVRASI